MPLLPRHAKDIRVTVTGLGKMGAFHAEALRQLAGGGGEAYYKSGLREQVGKIRICGLCDLDPARLRPFSGLASFINHRRMLQETRPDIAIIATPSRTHFSLALDSLAAGAHTLVEKPATTHVTQWQELVKIAAQHDLRIMAGHVERYNPVAIKLHTLLANNAFAVRDYAFQRSQPHDPRILDDIVTDKLIHDLDLALFFFGPISAHTLIAFRQVEGQTREVTLRLTHQNGVQGELFVSWLQPGTLKVRECLFRTLAGGKIRGDFVAKRLFLNAENIECSVPEWVKPDNNQIKDELADFIGYCLEPDPILPIIQPLLSTGEVGAATAITEQVATEINRKRDNDLSSRPAGNPRESRQ